MHLSSKRLHLLSSVLSPLLFSFITDYVPAQRSNPQSTSHDMGMKEKYIVLKNEQFVPTTFTLVAMFCYIFS